MRSWLYVPANKPKMMLNAGLYGADGLVFDLEDSVKSQEKDEARILVAEALRRYDFGSAALAVRINGLATPFWKEDLEAVVSAGAGIIRIPKVEYSGELSEAAAFLERLESSAGRKPGEVRIQAILETPRGIENAAALAEATPRLAGLSFGAEDYCAALGIDRSGPAYALDYPRSRVACAAALGGLEAWDTVWADFRNLAGLEEDARRARTLGFTGKSVIHPDQIEVANRIFSPAPEEAAWARKVVAAAGGTDDAGAFSLEGSMVDPPVIARARRILSRGGNENA